MNFDETLLDLLEINNWQYTDSAEYEQSQPVVADLSSLRAQVELCKSCSLHANRTQTVFGDGNPNAEIVFVGEAPGMHEDKQGSPFVGRAGQLLTTMLLALGIERKDVFITNVLKCRPPQNRDPNHQEITSCTPFLEKQLQSISPKIIVALGRHAAHYLLQTEQALGRLRQHWHQYQNYHLLVTYHPAYLLRNPGDKRKAWEDLCMLKNKLLLH